jgi:hypothetical protein
LQGFGKLLQTVDLVSKRINRDLKVTGVLLCMFDTRASLPNEVRADIERFLNNARGSASAWADAELLPTYIRRNIKLAEAPSYGRTIFEYDPTCNGAEDYKRVGQFFLGIRPEPEAKPEPELAGEPESAAVPDVTLASETAPEFVSEPVVESEPQTETQAETDSGATMDASEPRDISEPESSPAAVDNEPAVEPVERSYLTSEPSESELPVDETVVGSEEEEVHLPAVADAETAFVDEPPAEVQESQPQTPEPETMSLEEESQPNTDEAPPTPGPIQIREIHPPIPRRYTPPPLQRYPIGPSQQRDRDVPSDTENSPDEQEQGES